MPTILERFSVRSAAVKRRLNVVVPAAVLLAAAGARVADFPALQAMQNRVFDSYQRLKPRPYEDAPVRIIDLDDESIAKLGQWQWPRTLVAQAVDRLKELGASAIAFDIVFAEHDRTSPNHVLTLWPKDGLTSGCRDEVGKLPDHDQVLARGVAQAPVVMGSVLTDDKNAAVPEIKATVVAGGDQVASFLPEMAGAVKNLPELEKAAPGDGSFTTIPDPDGIIRRVPLVMRLGERLVPSLAAEAVRLAVKSPDIALFGGRTGIVSAKIGRLVAPTDVNGRLWVRYTGPAPARTIPIWRIFEKGFDPKALKDRIVFIGTSASGLRDQRATPLNPIAPGVEIHAQIAEQILLQKFLVRPDWALGAEVLYLLAFGAGVIFLLQRLGAVWGAVLAVGAMAANAAFSWLAFSQWQLLIDPLYPALSVFAVYLTSSLISYVRSEGERRQVRDTFSRYMSPAMVERLAEHPDQLKLGGETRNMTFHFCDIEGFTSISEFYDPQGLIKFLNEFLTPLSDIILKRRGTIDKYIGDCIMAFWNAPIDDPEHAKNACLAVLEMHAALKALNEEREAQSAKDGKKFIPIRIRTGLNTGPCIVGNMGSTQRFSYSVISDDVNLASRLEGANKFFGTHIMASEATYKEAQDAVEARELGPVKVVGKTHPIRVFELLAKKGELSEDWKKAKALYESGLASFVARKFEPAMTSFQEVLKIFPKDGPAALYLRMATDYVAIPPPEDWGNVFNLTAK